MAQGLSVSGVVSVQVALSPTAAVGRNFGDLLIIGSSPVIDTTERIREYSTLTGVAQDFGTTAPEYYAAAQFFAQSPQPYRLKIGRMAQQPTSGVLHSRPLGALDAPARLSTLQAISNGNLTLTIDGAQRTATGLNFGAVANMNGVAGVIANALSAYARCTWDGTYFNIASNSAGPGSTVGSASSTGGALLNVASLMNLDGAASAIPGGPSETPVACLQTLAGLSADFYAVTFATLAPFSDAVLLQVAATIEGMSPARVFGHTVGNPEIISPSNVTDLASVLQQSGYSRTVLQYSTTNAYAICSFFGRALSVNFNASRSALTMKFKQEPGTIPELLTETQARALGAKKANVFVRYANNTAIIQQGTVSSGRFWDEVHGLDWLSDAVQTDLFNVLYQSLTKIPQTDEGVHTLLTTFEATLARATDNGLLGPGIWNAEGFGQLKRGDPLPKGFYVFAPLIRDQAQSEREARRAPVMQAAIKLAGAIHSADVIINVNR